MRNIGGMGSARRQADLVCFSQEPLEGLSSGHFLLSLACVNQQRVGSLILQKRKAGLFKQLIFQQGTQERGETPKNAGQPLES